MSTATLTSSHEPTAVQNPAPMHRKHIMMSMDMIARVDMIAKEKNVSFAEVIRNAVDDYEETISKDDEALLCKLIDEAVKMTEDTAAKVDEVVRSMNETFDYLEAQRENQ